jgi:uncharacterized protein DUF664
MSTTGTRVESMILPESGCRSAIVALKLAELANVHAQLEHAAHELPAAALAWQPSPEDNTIGMLLTHIALAEVHLAQVGLLGERDGHVQDVLGITVEDDGMPLAEFDGPPAAIADKPAGYFLALLDKAFAHARAAGAPLEDARLGEEIRRPPRPDGSYRVYDRRWILHHMVEHASQHLGQVLVLRRMWKTAHPAA